MEIINYIKGDATSLQGNGNKIITHVCNDIGGWGRGFVLAISQRWPQPEIEYKNWYKSKENFLLGEVQFVQVEENIWVANMIGQRDIKKDTEVNPPVRYDAIAQALSKVAAFATGKKASVHMPRIGCGLAGGSWDKMEPVIIKELIEKEVLVNVYDL